MPARAIAAFAAIIPSCVAVTEDNAPLNLPMGVRAAERMTTSYQHMFRICIQNAGRECTFMLVGEVVA